MSSNAKDYLINKNRITKFWGLIFFSECLNISNGLISLIKRPSKSNHLLDCSFEIDLRITLFQSLLKFVGLGIREDFTLVISSKNLII